MFTGQVDDLSTIGNVDRKRFTAHASNPLTNNQNRRVLNCLLRVDMNRGASERKNGWRVFIQAYSWLRGFLASGRLAHDTAEDQCQTKTKRAKTKVATGFQASIHVRLIDVRSDLGGL